MGLLSGLFGKAKPEKSYDAILKEDLTLNFDGETWDFKGRILRNLKEQITGPTEFLSVLTTLIKEHKFNRVCFITTPDFILAVCDTKPPLAIETALSSETTVKTMEIMLKSGFKLLHSGNGIFLLTGQH